MGEAAQLLVMPEPAARKKYRREWESRKRRTNSAYRAKLQAKDRARHARDPRKAMLEQARVRAKRANVPCSITREDIYVPLVCPALKIPLRVGSRKLHDASPTLDRIISSRGYVRGNVAVISHRANRIKSNASIQELYMVLSWFQSLEITAHE